MPESAHERAAADAVKVGSVAGTILGTIYVVLASTSPTNCGLAYANGRECLSWFGQPMEQFGPSQDIAIGLLIACVVCAPTYGLIRLVNSAH